MEEPREETEREALLFGRKPPAKGAGCASRRGWRQTGVSFIIPLPERTRIFIDYRHPCSVGMTERCKERSKKRNGRATEEENGKSRDIWARGRARGSFHTFLQSLFLLSSWKELIFMSVLEHIHTYLHRASDARGRIRRDAGVRKKNLAS